MYKSYIYIVCILYKSQKTSSSSNQ